MGQAWTHFQYVFSTIMPVFLMIGLGYLAFRRGILPQNGHKALAAFVFNFGLPAAIFSALSTKSLGEVWHTDYILAYTLGSLVAFALVFIYAIWMLRRTPVESVVLGLGGSFSNSLLIGFPIIFFLFDTPALIPFSLTLIVENLIMLPLLLGLADMADNNSGANLKGKMKETALNLAKNPIVLSIVLGLVCSAMSLHPPQAAERIIDMLASTVTGVALFTIGGGLVGVSVSGMKREIGTVMIAKLLIHPLSILVMLMLVFQLDPMMSSVGVILASVPMFGVYAVIGQRYQMGGLCSAVLLPTTLLGMLTVSAFTTLALILF